VIRSCSSCGQNNRVPPKHLADVGRCGKCQTPFGPLDAPLAVNAGELDAITRDARVPVLVDLWAAWCGPCRRLAPEIEKLAKQMAGKAIVLKVDTEANPDVSRRYEVSAIPTLLIMKDGQLWERRAGLASHAELRRWLERAGASATA
jgi:thioredoxin 2